MDKSYFGFLPIIFLVFSLSTFSQNPIASREGKFLRGSNGCLSVIHQLPIFMLLQMGMITGRVPWQLLMQE